MNYRIFLFSFLTFLLFSCGEISTADKTEKIVLELDSSKVIQVGSAQLYPILNKKSVGQLLLKIEKQDGSKLEVDFDVDLGPNERLQYSVNNGGVHVTEDNQIKLELLEGNNVVFVCLTNAVGVSSSSWVRNYYVGEGKGSFDSTATHLFQNNSKINDGLVLDYYQMNQAEGKGVEVKLTVDTTSVVLPINQPYLIKNGTNLRIQLVNLEGNLIEGPFNDSGLIGY